MDMNVLVTLLTIAVVLLSIVIVALLVTLTIVLVKVQRVINNLDAITQHVASASEWFSPVKVINYIAKLVRR